MILQAPFMLLLLLILPPMGMLLLRAQRKQEAAAEKLRGRLNNRVDILKRRRRSVGLTLGAFAALILALARPAWNPHAGPAALLGRDLVIALDISRSMLAEDLLPNRLEAARIALFESLEHLQGQRIGLITFAGSASVRVPLTLDHQFVRYMLERASPDDAEVGSTSIQAAIEKALDVVLRESEPGNQDILLLTDGEDLLSDIVKTGEQLRNCGARVLLVGLGDPVNGAPVPANDGTNRWMHYQGSNVITRLDDTKLAQLAEASPNVIYYSAATRPFELAALYRRLLEKTVPVRAGESGRTVYTEGYPLFIAIALALLTVPGILTRRLKDPFNRPE